jgi:hypothetical protein
MLKNDLFKNNVPLFYKDFFLQILDHKTQKGEDVS